MTYRSTMKLIALILLAGAVFSAVQATTITAEGGTIPTIGETRDFPIVADEFPDGLLGYSLDAVLTEPSKAEIMDVLFPAWAPSYPFSWFSTTPADEVGIRIFGYQVNSGQTNVTLATLRIRGDAVGQTEVNITIKTLQDGSGNKMTATTVPGTIIIGAPPTVTTATTATTATTTTATTATTATPPPLPLPHLRRPRTPATSASSRSRSRQRQPSMEPGSASPP